MGVIQSSGFAKKFGDRVREAMERRRAEGGDRPRSFGGVAKMLGNAPPGSGMMIMPHNSEDDRAGTPMKMKKGGKAKKMAKGGSTASKRADGCATKGKTKGRFV